MIYTEKNIRESRLVAIRAHGNQVYDEIFPYEKHLDDVISVLKRFGFGGKYIVAGYLHDTIEDGALSYGKIEKHFGNEVAEMVYCVTDELGRNRKERKSKTYPKLAQNQDAIVIKLADRIANVEHGGLKDMYKKEYKEFRNAIYQPDRVSASMWEYLDNMMSGKLDDSFGFIEM
jgi:(p)ppGpp synthase/HD superfamily hydrolase